MKIYKINDDTESWIVDILINGITSDMLKNENLCDNYLYERREHPANLFRWLSMGRYKDGGFYVITENENFVACAGWYPYNQSTAIVLSRMLVNPKYRTQYFVGQNLLPIMMEESIRYNRLWITCNEYNKSIYNWFLRTSEGKSPVLFKNWPDIYRRFKPMGQMIINGVTQYVVELER